MRELTKSMLSFSLAMPLFGMKQMMEMAMPRDPSRPFGKATDGFDAVTGATAGQMEGSWKSAFAAGDRLQRGMVDLVLGVFTGDSFDLNRMMRMSSDMLRTSVGAVSRGIGDCGCGPGPSAAGPAPGGGSAHAAGSPAAPSAASSWSAPGPADAAGAAPGGGSPFAPVAAGTDPALHPPPGWKVSVPADV